MIISAITFAISSISYVAEELFINPLPHLDEDSIICEYYPIFKEFYSIHTDDNGNFYLHSEVGTLQFDQSWNYEKTYLMKPGYGHYLLQSADNGLSYIYSRSTNEHWLYSYNGKLISKWEETIDWQDNYKNKTVTDKNGMEYTMKTNFLFSSVVDANGNKTWHSSYIGMIVRAAISLSAVLFMLMTVQMVRTDELPFDKYFKASVFQRKEKSSIRRLTRNQ